ncbi:uncharacterized protein BX664DRAFT_331243 [Halteromyces radiatus]|uniref:uncharacterized protein n=1 Tax=Halteromyces radiatus TaxID=101107 RepID=UPI00221F5B45|nr:uncharacterized protein BX664DRAFT_331243 [Halteromyces radiatus]KAI8088728.1 hypothetical protein BX664DRAFT_331243 [Halteromyces radiatus]
MSSALSPVADCPTAHYSDYHHLHTDEIIISDIFTGIEGARRSIISLLAFSADDLLLAFPSSIQYLYCMHYIIRSWVIHEVTASKIDLNTRVARIDVFVQMMRLSRRSCQKMELFTELKESATSSSSSPPPPPPPKTATSSTNSSAQSSTYVPGFVENAIASALVSPEVRLFTKAWKVIGQKYGVSDLDTLAPLMKNLSSRTMESPGLSSQQQTDFCFAPSIGWVFERMIELSLVVPDTYHGMIHFDKGRYMFKFLQLMMNAQVKLEKQSTTQAMSMSFLISPNDKKRTWKMLKEEAHKEKNHHYQVPVPPPPPPPKQQHRHGNKIKSSHSSSSTTISSSSSSFSLKHGVFSKLVAAQMEKLRRDIKERERIDREWKEVQQKWQKRQLEQMRPKHGKKHGYHRRYASSSSLNTGSSQQQQQQDVGVIPTSSLSGTPPHGIKWPALLRTFRPPSVANFHMDDSSIDTTAKTCKLRMDDDSNSARAAMVINLIHATTSIASGYEKRAFVFRVVTEEGAQYLLQGANVDDMQSWMDEINQAARHGTAKRRSVFAAESKETMTMTPEVTTKNKKKIATTTRTTVYGIPLETLQEREHHQVPNLVTTCIKEIELRGLEEVGIYRVAGTGSVVQQLKKEFNTQTNVNVDVDHYPDINVVADALKQFLRELPEPLLTFALYEEFINASASDDHDDRVYKIKQVIQKLPPVNYQLLKRLLEHFVIVTDYEAINHMYATNLAIVFGPTLLQPMSGPAAFTTSMSNLGHHQNIVKYLILHYHYLFDIEGAE